MRKEGDDSPNKNMMNSFKRLRVEKKNNKMKHKQVSIRKPELAMRSSVNLVHRDYFDNKFACASL